MKHRIIKVNSIFCDAVSLNIVREGEEGDDVVKIQSWHYNTEDESHYFHEKTVFLPSFELCERFIEDFSQESAVTFVKLFQF